MNTAVILLETNTDAQMRAIINAAFEFSAETPHFYCICSKLPACLSELPVEKIKVLQASSEFLPYLITEYMQSIPANYAYYFLGGEDANLMGAMLAAKRGVYCISNCIRIHLRNETVFASRFTHGYKIISTFELSTPPCVFTLETEHFPPLLKKGRPKLEISQTAVRAANCLEQSITPVRMQTDLDQYQTVLIGGRGLGNQANAQALTQLAKKLNVGLGATRLAIYNGWFPLNRLVGASGWKLKAKTCILFGVSGCMPLMLGVQSCERLIAVNHDPAAQIFEYCHEGIVGDCNAIIAEMLNHSRRIS
jgi:electron transfer flavoprotein alpha subunit